MTRHLHRIAASRIGRVVASMTRHLHHTAAKSPRQRHLQHDSTVLSPALLGIYITPQPSCLGSIVASMTAQHCHQHDSTSISCLDNAIASMTRQRHHAAAKSPRQHYHQHDSTVTSCHGQHHLDSTIVGMTRGLRAYFPNQQSDSEVHR
jgi:hypothetical protein